MAKTPHDDPQRAQSPPAEITETDQPAQLPLMPRLALWLAVLVPPVGTVMGHLWLVWTKDEMTWSQTDEVLHTRRPAWAAVFIGWPMTLLVVAAAVTGVSWWQQESAQEAEQRVAQEAEEQTREEITQAASDSPSAGEVDQVFCTALLDGVVAEVPVTGFVYEYQQISDELLTGLEQAGEGVSPNEDVYADYREHLLSFNSAEEFDELDEGSHTGPAEDLVTALDADQLGCVDLDEQNLDTLMDIHDEQAAQLQQPPQ